MMPYTVMVMAIIGYVGAVAVAMVGAPLWIAAHAIPTGEGFVNEGSKQGYRLLLSLFAKPPLIIFGFFLSLAMFSAGVYLINNTFFSALSVVLGTASYGEASIATSGLITDAVMDFNNMVVFLIGGMAMIFILVSLYLTLAKWAFGLMNVIPDNALSWAGMQDIQMGEERAADEALIGQAYAGAKTVGGGASQAASAEKGRRDGIKQKKDNKDAADAAKAERAKETEKEDAKWDARIDRMSGAQGVSQQGASDGARENE